MEQCLVDNSQTTHNSTATHEVIAPDWKKSITSLYRTCRIRETIVHYGRAHIGPSVTIERTPADTAMAAIGMRTLLPAATSSWTQEAPMPKQANENMKERPKIKGPRFKISANISRNTVGTYRGKRSEKSKGYA
jgi:hypothetical protein